MANPLPNSLALTTINDNAQIIASDHRNNYAAIQSAVNALRAALAGGVAGQFLQASDGTDVQWATIQKYRKVTAKQVVNTVAATDLLNGEITVGGGVLGTSGVLRLTAWGDSINNSGGVQAAPRFQLSLGGSVLLDTGAPASVWSTNVNRWGWRIVAEIVVLGAANSQWASLEGLLAGSFASGVAGFTTGEGAYAFTNLTSEAQAIGGKSGAVDTTVAQALGLVVILPAVNASLDVTLKGALVEIV